mmetsp:Transcript_15133/g.18438  ORF Transcript_15133/g.18438 Transcript_15133/m.18438 type:complete len:466 (+) Transcript_15133:118-1515(+)
MTDPFRQFFLDTVEKIIDQEPSQESLLGLLQLVSPQLTLSELHSSHSDERNKIYRSVMKRIHPDKHPNDSRVTTIFQNVQNFYDDCREHFDSSSLTSVKGKVPASNERTNQKGTTLRTRKRRKHGKGSLSSYDNNIYPQEFYVYSKWSYMNVFSQQSGNINSNNNDEDEDNTDETEAVTRYPYPPNHKITSKTLGPFQAYKCIHARGALAHGRRITKYFSWNNVEEHGVSNHTVTDVFKSVVGGDIVQLTDVNDIKEELMTRGPVVSVSFKLTNAYLSQLGRDRGAFAVEQNTLDVEATSDTTNGQKNHELLIVGWSLTPYGEAWKVQFLFDQHNNNSATSTDNANQEEPSFIHIGFGQFGIDELCLAPKKSLDHIPWQCGQHFDAEFSDVPEWREWKQMDLPIVESELVLIGNCFKRGMFTGESFVLRDRDKVAHSANYTIKNLRWNDETNEWIITVHSVDEEK